MRITMRKEEYRRITKTTYELIDTETTEITESNYEKIVSNDTVKWFQSIGGSEVRVKKYTDCGYKVTKLTSKSPNRDLKTIRIFTFSV
jgi:hypothetical protein